MGRDGRTPITFVCGGCGAEVKMTETNMMTGGRQVQCQTKVGGLGTPCRRPCNGTVPIAIDEVRAALTRHGLQAKPGSKYYQQ